MWMVYYSEMMQIERGKDNSLSGGGDEKEIYFNHMYVSMCRDASVRMQFKCR